MLLRRLWLTDFRSYTGADVSFGPGLTAIVGANGEGKTNLLEAIGWLATLSSFRGASADVLIRDGQSRAVVRGEVEREGRELLIESELIRDGRNRAQINRQPLRRHRDLLGALQVTAFAPDDLALIKGGPGGRRRYLDDALVAQHPSHDRLRVEVDRVLRQRNSLLKQSGGRLDADAALTLDVWDAKLTAAGEALDRARQAVLADLAPALEEAYGKVAPHGASVETALRPAWREAGLAVALHQARSDDLRRGYTTVGPHRDDLEVRLDGREARSHASQGEQRSLALALRLAAHEVAAAAAGSAPVLLLDDVFSELDPGRSAALLGALPGGQILLTTASGIPVGAEPAAVLRIENGRIVTAMG